MAENNGERRRDKRENEQERRAFDASRRQRPVRGAASPGENEEKRRVRTSVFPKGTPLHAERRGERRVSYDSVHGSVFAGDGSNRQAPPRQTRRPQGEGRVEVRRQPTANGGVPRARRVDQRPDRTEGRSASVRSAVYPVRSGKAPSASRGQTSRRGTYAVTARSTVAELAGEIAQKRREHIVAQNERREITERKRNIGIIRTRSGVDRAMLVIILVLLALGTVAVFSASYPAALADPKISSPLYYIRKQIIFAILGIIVMIVASLFPPAFYKRIAPFVFGVTALLLVAVPIIGIDYQGTKRWVGIPGTDFSVQPSEMMKFAVVLMLAWYLDKFRDRVTDRLSFKNTFWFGVFFPGIIVAFSCGLVIIEKHLSATAIIAAIGVTVMVIGGSHVGLTLAGTGIAGAGAFGVYLLKNPYALKRVSSKLDEDANVLAERWQTTQGLYAIGNGGPFGVGLGSSIQKYSYVSEAHTDFIFTIWCEETGFVGALAVILLYLLFIWRGFKIAMHAPDTFSALTVYGLTAHVGIQAFLNMLVVTDNMFNTGVSLPFFSYGGSSLIFLMAEMGIILSISKHSFQKS